MHRNKFATKLRKQVLPTTMTMSVDRRMRRSKLVGHRQKNVCFFDVGGGGGIQTTTCLWSLVSIMG